MSLINDILDAEAKGVEYECIVDPVLDDYYIGDAMKLQQVLINILNNAIKFTGEGGKVTFSASQRRKTKNDAMLRFIVNDTGVGMGDDFIPHIFEPFSQESTGTTSLYGGTGAEDNQINTEVAMMLLESKGFKVDTAENGLRALELFSKSDKGYYDAILMDIRMPLMDGLTAATNIRHLSNADSGTIPIIAMTANAFDDDIEKSKAAGMNAHLAKPIEPERMYQTLYDFIYGKEA